MITSEAPQILQSASLSPVFGFFCLSRPHLHSKSLITETIRTAAIDENMRPYLDNHTRAKHNRCRRALQFFLRGRSQKRVSKVHVDAYSMSKQSRNKEKQKEKKKRKKKERKRSNRDASPARIKVSAIRNGQRSAAKGNSTVNMARDGVGVSKTYHSIESQR